LVVIPYNAGTHARVHTVAKPASKGGEADAPYGQRNKTGGRTQRRNVSTANLNRPNRDTAKGNSISPTTIQKMYHTGSHPVASNQQSNGKAKASIDELFALRSFSSATAIAAI
jgi:hypothetical protein